MTDRQQIPKSFPGASSTERLPTEVAIVEHMFRFAGQPPGSAAGIKAPGGQAGEQA